MKAIAMTALLIAAPLAAAETTDLAAKADEGDVAAQLALGQAHASGKGAPKDLKAAVEWLTKAADQGSVDACMALGKLYLGGSGMPKSGIDAAKWFRLAADRGNPAAQCQVARMHLAGTGVPKDDLEACKWAKVAFAQGDRQAKGILDFLYRRMTAEQVAKAEALAREIIDSKPAPGSTPGVPPVAPPLEKEPD
jgi:TPR repeat protein